MADSISIDAQGLKALRRKMKKAGMDVKDLKAVNRAAGDLVIGEAQRRAPAESGAARRSTKVSVRQTGASIVAGTSTKAKDYAARQHWSQQDGKAGEEWVFKAVGNKGRAVAKLYYDHVKKIVDELNRAGMMD